MVSLLDLHRCAHLLLFIPDKNPDGDGVADMPAVLERGSTHAVGTFIPIDYQRIDPFLGIPDASADLVTMVCHMPVYHYVEET